MGTQDFEINEDNIIHNLNRTYTYAKITGLQLFKINSLDITPEHFATLYFINRDNGLYQRQLSKLLLKDRPNITRIINILEKKELVYRKNDKDNRKIFKLFITDKGKQELNRTIPIIKEAYSKLSSGITVKEIEIFNKVLKKIRSNLETSSKIQI